MLSAEKVQMNSTENRNILTLKYIIMNPNERRIFFINCPIFMKFGMKVCHWILIKVI